MKPLGKIERQSIFTGDKIKLKTLEQEPKSENSFKSSIKTVLLALTLALIVRSFLFEPFHIPSGSMKPTLLVGDYVFVSKYSYGYSRYSFPLGLAAFSGRIFEGDNKPERGDVVVFRYPKNPKINYIKRLIGLPGDRIHMKDGILFINDKIVLREYKGSFIDDDGGEIETMSQYLETLPNGKSYYTLDHYSNSSADNTIVFVVPEEHYFFMGDNRDHSADSRFVDGVGFVPADKLVGKAQVVFFSTSGSFWRFWEWKYTVRQDRIFSRI